MAKPLQKTVLTPVPATAAPEPVKKGRKAKPTQWAKWAKSAFRFSTLVRNLDAIAQTDQTTFAELNKKIPSDESLTEIAELVSALQKLDADQVKVPTVPKAPKGPKFSVGDKVKIVKKFRDKYLDTGLYGAVDLDSLTVILIGKKDQVLCGIDGGSIQVFVRYAKHLEKR